MTAAPTARAVDVGAVEQALTDSERDVLAVVLYGGRLPDEARVLTVDDFADTRSRAIWAAVLRLDEQGAAIDPATVAVELQRRDDPAVRVGRPELVSLAGECAIPAALPTYVRHVQEAAERRRAREAGTRLLQAADLGDIDAARQHAVDAVAALTAPRPATQPPRGQLRIRDLADIAHDVESRPPRQLLFDPVWPQGDYGVLSAEAKAGKTWALADAAISCASGTPWLGQFTTTAPGAVLMFLGEGGPSKMLRRLRAVADNKGITGSLAALPIRLDTAVPRLNDRAHIDQVAAELEQHPAQLVILDPLYIAAAGAKGSDLYAMGEVLYAIQQVVQAAGASLLVAHHWNKGGRGFGHDRSSGVGPGAWGRVLVSVAVDHQRTEPDDSDHPGMTTVRQTWSFTGDEISDPGLALIRRVWADDPHDLNSRLRYELERTEPRRPRETSAGAAATAGDDKLSPAERKVQDILTADPAGALTAKQIGDRYADLHGTGLRRETLARALNRLRELTLADETGTLGPHGAKYWTALLPDKPTQPALPTCDEV